MATTTIWIQLDVNHEEGVDVHDIVDRVLDNGTLQDAIKEYADDVKGEEVEVANALCVSPVSGG